MEELTINDFRIGQQVGVVWRSVVNEKTTFKLDVGKISNIKTNKNGTKVTVSPKIFRSALDIEEFDDYREINKRGLVIVNTPLLLSNITIEHLKGVVERWNENPPN